MKLYTNCMSCKKDVIIKSKSQTRPDLQMEKGSEFSINCLSCGKTDKKHVNDIKAEIDKKILLIGIGIGVVLSIGLSIFYGVIATLIISFPLLFWQQQMKSTKSFNSFLIRRK
ncbi:hypothetical protein [Tenacibaculum sp. Bg11-29]|uniref:hypothetical protein n=1 Tax=Tenacibaculum sp. Bg11-29 TaxID=2058306 RepID=UPI0012FEE46C|nr:hypothetical protein [Tenacibaculum sp. Bg11-29]